MGGGAEFHLGLHRGTPTSPCRTATAWLGPPFTVTTATLNTPLQIKHSRNQCVENDVVTSEMTTDDVTVRLLVIGCHSPVTNTITTHRT